MAIDVLDLAELIADAIVRKQSIVPQQIEDLLNAKGFLTTREFASAFKVNQGRVIQWINDGALPALDIRTEGGPRPIYRLLRSHLEYFLNSRGTMSAPHVANQTQLSRQEIGM